MPSEQHLHIVSFDIPCPPSYGGVIDVYYKIAALSGLGVKIHLHAFYNGNLPLEKNRLVELCHEINYYPRKLLLNPFNRKVPLMVQMRHSSQLLKKLTLDEYPVLFEGIHCTAFLNHAALNGRQQIVRMHNIEYLYYKNLARVETRFLKKIYLGYEAERLKSYEQLLKNASLVAAISPADHRYLTSRYHNSFYLPVFHPNTEIISQTGKGEYLLYHGNLGIAENNEAALFLVNEVFNKLDLPLIIAGSDPAKSLSKAVSGKKHIRLISGISTTRIYDLLRNAQINLLPTFQNTGIKLKLINSLFQGRFCIANSKMVKETGLESLCLIADHPDDFRNLITEYYNKAFTSEDLNRRKEILKTGFNNSLNARLLIDRLK